MDFLARIDTLAIVFDQLSQIDESGGRTLLAWRGWKRCETGDACHVLGRIRNQLGYWAITADQVSLAPQEAGEDGIDVDGDVVCAA